MIPLKVIWKQYAGPVIWITALLLLFFMDPASQGTSFCLFKFIGFSYCPGCGIGHSIHYALHLNMARSFDEHVLGIPATLAILYTIVVKLFFKRTKPVTYGPAANIHDVA